MFEDAPWEVTFDERFRSSLEDLDQSSGELKENVSKTVRSVVENPLKGDPKTGQLRGYRTTHVEHLVVVWELDPEIVSVEHLDKIEEVYFHNIKHHDKMREAIGAKSPIEVSRSFTVTFESYDVQSIISELYDCDVVDIADQNWNGDGVIVTGDLETDDTDVLEDILPDSASIEIAKPSIP